MRGKDVVLSLFHQALLLLLSAISADTFPLGALALLPLVMRRRLFLLLPIMNLHRLERDHPAATEGINMAEVWKELFTKRLCQHTKWLTESHTLKIIITSDRCCFRVSEIGYEWDAREIARMFFAAPLPFLVGLAKGRVRNFLRIKGELCTFHSAQVCTFFYSSNYIHLFRRQRSDNTILNPMYLEALSVLGNIFPVQIDSTLVIDYLAGLVSPPVNVTGSEFRRLLCYIHTLEFIDTGNLYHPHVPSLKPTRKFLEDLLGTLISNPDPVLQNLHLCFYSDGDPQLVKYCNEVITALAPFFSRTRSSKVTFQGLKGLKLDFEPSKQLLKKILAIVTHQTELESFDLSISGEPNPAAYDALFKAVAVGCWHKPTFQCLTLERSHVLTSTILDIEQEFLVSTACEKQELVLKDLSIHSSAMRRNILYAPESAACTKSLSVIRCEATDVGIFSTADIVSGVLLHPGIKSVNVSQSLDHVDLYKLTTALEQGAGTLKLLDLTGCDLSFIIVRAGPLFRAIFHLPHLSELELVLESCLLNEEDLDDLFCEWEKETSCRRKQRNRTSGRSLRKMCVCGNNILPEDKSNLEVMAQSLCY